MDDPTFIAPIVMPQNAGSGASQFTAPLLQSYSTDWLIGRREAVLGLNVLLTKCFNTESGAIDITDGIAFDWRRFVANTMERLQIMAMDIEKVFAVRTKRSGSPQFAFCTTATTCKMLDPTPRTLQKHPPPKLASPCL